MAQIIPALNQHSLSRMTAGEKRVARQLEALLEDDYWVWYDIPVGRHRRYPDFIILHPSRGLLFLEVKDWKPETLKGLTKTTATLLTAAGKVTQAHPLEQARQYALNVVNQLQKDPYLQQGEGKFSGKFAVPYGWGAIFSQITRVKIEHAMAEAERDILLPDHLVLYKEDISDSQNAENFQEKLWGMFHYRFDKPLSLPQIDRIRWHLFPEVRIDVAEQVDLFAAPDEPAAPVQIPDIIKIMDIQQEQLARSLGEGHRVIHGVAGSGKTMILGYRCVYLAQATTKPILVLCFNATLAAKLRRFIYAKGLIEQVHIYHFHDWCAAQLKTYSVSVIKNEKAYYIRAVESVIKAVDDGFIPRGQYGALLIDEGHDFEAAWLSLVVGMVDPETNALLMLYDDAQSIYKKKKDLDFSLASVGIKAQGRTTILRLNYRNSREILAFAFNFVKAYLQPDDAKKIAKVGDERIPLIEPQSAGLHGEKPAVRRFASFEAEVAYAIKCIQSWHANGVPYNDMAILYAQGLQGRKINTLLKKSDIPYAWLAQKSYKMAYDPSLEKVNLLTIHSSKGLEFNRVIIVGLGQIEDSDAKQVANARLLYVGMTRAQQCLLVTYSGENQFTQKLVS
ncbi:MAG: 3'-5' exonuclease [Marinagarivorans sp.]|nr:3'-5' exonuclease [Marinagarivorans sp.]